MHIRNNPPDFNIHSPLDRPNMATERSTERQIDISLFPQHYRKSYKVYLSRLTQQKETLKWIQGNLPNVLKRAGTKPKSPDAPLKVLGMGCGDGSSGDLLILEAVANYLSTKEESRPVIYNKSIEPRSKALSVFQSSAQAWERENNQNKVSFSWFSGTWQDYQEGTKQNPDKFHLIHFGSCVYYLQAEATLRDCLENRLVEDGLMVCMISGEDGPIARYFEQFNFTHCSTQTLIDYAAKNGWRHDVYHLDQHVDVTTIFDESSVEGNLLLDFLTQTVNFGTVNDKKNVTEVMQFWLDNSVVNDDGKRVVQGKLGVIVIFK